MRSIKILCGFSCGVLLSSASLAVIACENPSLPNLPPEKGRIRDREERLIEIDTLRYVREMESYVGCLQTEHAAVAGDGEPSLEASPVVTTRPSPSSKRSEPSTRSESVRSTRTPRVPPKPSAEPRPTSNGAATTGLK
jgi:hypothetical protein